jgi:hypothetical protein
LAEAQKGQHSSHLKIVQLEQQVATLQGGAKRAEERMEGMAVELEEGRGLIEKLREGLAKQIGHN